MKIKINIIEIAVIIIFLCLIAAQFNSTDKLSERLIMTDTYTVMQGDTLWSIAKEYCPAGMDKRDYIYDIKTRNKLDSAVIYIGQELELQTAERKAMNK